jgi:hypothetical protein
MMNPPSVSRGRLGGRTMGIFIFVFAVTGSFVLDRQISADEQDDSMLSPIVGEYLKQFCYRCHADALQKGGRRLDQFQVNPAADDETGDLLEDVLNAINRGEMPPEGKGIASPPAEKTRQVVESITRYLNEISSAKQPTTTTLRRQNRTEYRNTLRDLLGLHIEAFDPTSDFPADATDHGFDNNGETLTLSNYQLQRYVEVAQEALDKAVFFDVPRPQSQVWQYSGKDFNGVRSYERAPVTWRLIVNDDFLEIGHGQPSERHANYVKAFVRLGGVPADGWYTIRLRAAAANRLDHRYEHQEFDRFQVYPLKMALWIAPEERLLDKTAADQRRLVKVWDLPDRHPQFFTQRVWLQKGAIPFVSWVNGISSKGNIRRVAEKHHPEVIRATKTQLDSARLGNLPDKAIVAKLLKNKNNKLLSEVYHGPRIRIWSMDIAGPFFDQWPPTSHRLLFGQETDAVKVNLEEAVARFASRAFRRPVEAKEVEHYIDFIRHRIGGGESHANAIKLGLAGILTSPRFLYLDEGNDQADANLEPFEFASRLSYFLWSSMPDEELIAAAASGQLRDRKSLADQVDRLLSDEKSRGFVEHFTDSWLRINTLGSMPPDPKAFGDYYRDRLELLFKKETRTFFADLLENNGSILNLIDSDYIWVNDALAAHYDIEGVRGERFRKVALKPEHRRGGLLGQGSILTLTANGIETSPVVRGVWVLENLLGTPPSPPPPDVEPLEPDTRGAVSIRAQLQKHRTVSACADCHKKIDPAGFALEYYDPIGGYRLRYPARGGKGVPVDGSGQLPTGEEFQDERGLKRHLLEHKERFTEALAEKLLTYATGRTMTFQDQAAVEQVAALGIKKGYRLRDLLIAVVMSDAFRKR